MGGALKTEIDQYQSFTLALDLNKYLVPSPPVYSKSQFAGNNQPIIVSGVDPNTLSVPAAIFGSFTDAPGIPIEDPNFPGKPLYDESGKVVTVKGSKLKEELREVIISVGAEYWYRDILAFRAGYFHEDRTKGAREFVTFGMGVQYQFLGVDLSYLSSLNQNNPLANTLRLTLRFNFDKTAIDG